MLGDGPSSPNYGLGFVLTCVAGFATVLGVGFVPLLSYGAPRTVTSAALGFAAGVMLYVSFVDVLGEEAKEFFEDHFKGGGGSDETEDGENVMVRISVAVFFFLGIGLAMVLLRIMDAFHSHGHGPESSPSRDVELSGERGERPSPSPLTGGSEGTGHDHQVLTRGRSRSLTSDQSSLERVSLVAFVALTLHNFPEGLATFFGGGNKSFAVPFAIAMHNIPEGAAIAIPIYQSSGSVMKAVRNTCIAGLAQPAGALMGWILILGLGVENVSNFVYGALYSATAGIMVCVSIMELIPEALQGGSPFFVGCCIFGGFLIMEVSIILLGLSGL
ncbi:unnamed protein product [Prorocentrum cordatum]|uniref:Zinc/iron permease n=1 Tax=Prorocentrum cordatum TaxID=2364126 RepID=A0ABN9T3Q0_9DINO|nr:unnamed protein product [Polarella glacialis]